MAQTKEDFDQSMSLENGSKLGPDGELEQELRIRCSDAEQRIEALEFELRQWRRTQSACAAGLDQLDKADTKMERVG